MLTRTNACVHYLKNCDVSFAQMSFCRQYPTSISTRFHTFTYLRVYMYVFSVYIYNGGSGGSSPRILKAASTLFSIGEWKQIRIVDSTILGKLR